MNQLFEPSQEDNSFLPEKNESQTILSSNELIRVKDRIPPYYQSIIPFEYFNRIQSKVCDSILQTNTNIVISAPTVDSSSLYHYRDVERQLFWNLLLSNYIRNGCKFYSFYSYLVKHTLKVHFLIL